MAAKTEEIRAIFLRWIWPKPADLSDEELAERFRIGKARIVSSPASQSGHSANSGDSDEPLFNPDPLPTKFASEISIKGEFSYHDLEPQLEYRFYGTKASNPQYGEEIAVKTYVIARPHSKEGIIKYLQQAPSIGPAFALSLWNRFRGDAVRVLRESPDVASAAVKGLTLEKATKAAVHLEELAALEDTSIEMIELLAGRGFPKKTAMDAVRIWGNEAAERIRRDPYCLMRFRGCGFLRTDAMYLDLGLPAHKMKRQVLSMWHTLASDSDGHTWFPLATAISGLKAKISGVDVEPDKALAIGMRAGALQLVEECGACGASGKARIPDLFADAGPVGIGSSLPWLETADPCEACGGGGVREISDLRHADPAAKKWISESRKADAEDFVAEKVAEMLEWDSSWPELDHPAFEGLTEHQREQASKAFAGAICSLGGRPGGGKSFVAAALIKAIVDECGSGHVAIAAPTGKAACRCNEMMSKYNLPITATTIHRMLVVQSSSDGWSFLHGEHMPLPYKYVIIDECFPGSTLVDTPSGKRCIRDIKAGDSIYNAMGVDSVVATNKKRVDNAVKINAGAASIICSENHPIFTARGVILARDIGPGDSILQTESAVRLMRQDSTGNEEEPLAAFLQFVLQHEMVDAVQGVQGQNLYTREGREGGSGTKGIPGVWHPGGEEAGGESPSVESNEESRFEGANVGNAQEDWPQAEDSRREWNGHDGAPEAATAVAIRGLGGGTGDTARREAPGISDLLQGGHRELEPQNCDRMRRYEPQCHKEASSRQKEGREIEFARVDGVEILECGHPELDQFRDADGALYFYDLQAARHPSFSVEGCLVHNCSMVNTGLMASVLAAIGKGTNLILIGDVNQLLPVEYGAPLRDIRQHVPYGELTEILRNAGTIVRACGQIQDIHQFQVDGEINLDAEPPANLSFIPASPDAAADRIIELLRRIRDEGKFDPVWDTQVLIAVNEKSPLSRKHLNKLLQAELNPAGETVKGSPFRKNDKVIQLKNGFLPMIPEDRNSDDEKVFVANGEIGRVLEVHEKKTIVEFPPLRQDEPPRRVLIPRGKQEGDSDSEGKDGKSEGKIGTGCDLDLAFAITVHKCQGSSAPVIIVVVDEYPGATGKYGVCDRAWLYTAISRAEQVCYLVGKMSTARGLCKRSFIERRKTLLSEKIRQKQWQRIDDRKLAGTT